MRNGIWRRRCGKIGNPEGFQIFLKIKLAEFLKGISNLTVSKI